MKATHVRPRPARRRAVRAFVLTFCATAIVLTGVWAGLVADVRTRRVCDGGRAESVYTRLTEAIRPPADLAALSDATIRLAPPTPPDAGFAAYLPYPLRLLWAIGAALEPPPPTGADAVPVMAG